MSVTDVGHGVHIGDFIECDLRGRAFPLCVHVWSRLNLSEGRACRVCRGVAARPDRGMLVEWSEGQPLGAMGVPVGALAEYFRRPGDVLIHCAAGACRSPTLALVAKLARGDGPWGATGHIFRRTWEARGFTPDFRPVPTGDVLRWWGAGMPAA